MALTIIRKQQIRTVTTNGSDVSDADQLSGNDLLIVQNGSNNKLVSDLTVSGATTGAQLVAVDNIAGQTTVRGALGFIEPGAKFVGAFASVGALPAAASHTGRIALVFGAGGTVDGLYKSNGATWDFSGAVINRSGVGPYIYDLSGIELGNIGDSLSANSAVKKSYVDALITGIRWKNPVDYKADYVTNTVVNLLAISVTASDNGKYGFAINGDGGNGTLYVVAGGIWTVAGSLVSGQLLLLNGTTVPTGGVNTDIVLEYQSATGENNWDYTNIDGRNISPTVNDARIYKIDDSAYTYDLDTTSWILIDSSSGTIGTRDYTEENIVTDFESITNSIDQLDIQIGNRDYTNGLILTDNEKITISLEKLNLLGSTSTGQGASKIGIEDAGSYYTGTTVEAALAEIGAQVGQANVKGTFCFKQTAGTDTAVGKLSFANNAATIIIEEASNFANFTTFLAAVGNITWGTGSAGDYSARRSALAAGFDIQVEVNGKVEPPIQFFWDDTANTFTITLDGVLKTNDLVAVNLVRNNF